MSFSACNSCIQIKGLGCYAACSPVTLPLVAPMDGIYTLMYYYGGTWIQKEVTIDAAPENIVVSNFFPANTEVILKIIDPNGYLFKFSILRDVLGVKDLQNPDDDCCTKCITHFRLKTELTLSAEDIAADTPLMNACETGSS